MRQFLVSRGLDELATSPYPRGGSLLDAYCETLALGRLQEWAPRKSYPTAEAWRERILDERFELDQYFAKILLCLKDSHFFETESGYFGVSEGPIGAGKCIGLLV